GPGPLAPRPLSRYGVVVAAAARCPGRGAGSPVLQGCPELSRSGFRDLPPARAVRALTVLDRAAIVRPRLGPVLMQVLESDLESLATSAISVAVQTGDPIGRLLAKVLDGQGEVPPSLLGFGRAAAPTDGLAARGGRDTDSGAPRPCAHYGAARACGRLA